MKKSSTTFSLIILAMLTFSCVSQDPLIDEIAPSHFVLHTSERVNIESYTDHFSDEVIKSIQRDDIIGQTGDELLKQVIKGYQDFTGNYEYTDERELSDWVIQVDEITVRKGFMSLNIPHPGPIYKVSMIVSFWDNNELKHTKTYSARANMSQVNFPDEAVHWMSKEEKMNTEYQLNTFEKALLELYQQLYFESFGISL
ncbi:hypothetical protein AB2B38_011405 [Balneola sp. MJW-20]|uniref:hypothetical protein n=1 Tax=Gracilimonas aurantiaca TaxID=3234185 RepID=UPI0034658DAE